jgi:tetratricopeptide (TPR) repeat protein
MNRLVTMVAMLAIIALSVSVSAQQGERQLLQKGMKLENGGDVEAAIVIYKRILGQNGRNIGALYRLASAYLKVGRFEDGISLLKTRLKRAPGDITSLNRLADLYLAAGNEEEADRQIERILQIGANQSTYTTVGQRYERRNQDKKALSIYLRGRKELANAELFSREVAQIHERAENYPSAVREYGALVRQKPQYVALVESKLTTIAGVAPDPVKLFDQLHKDVKAGHRDSRATRLFVTFAIASGLAADALDALLVLPPDARIEGSLLRIGRETLEHGDPGYAVRAFDALAARTRNRTIVAQARAGIARGLDLLGRSDEALEAYAAILSSKGPVAGTEESAYRLGDLLRRLNRSDEAIAALRTLADAGSPSKWRIQAIDLLGDIHVTQAKPEDAAHWYGLNMSENRAKNAGIEATYKLGRLYMMERTYSTAQKALTTVLNGGLASLVYNDALELSDIIETGLEEDQEGLDTYAESLRLEARGDQAMAAKIALNGNTNGPLIDPLRRRGIEIRMAEAAWKEAEQALRGMLNARTALASWATYTLGRCLEHQRRVAEAIDVYETVLATYPFTLEADRSRERLTDLRSAQPAQRETG